MNNSVANKSMKTLTPSSYSAAQDSAALDSAAQDSAAITPAPRVPGVDRYRFEVGRVLRRAAARLLAGFLLLASFGDSGCCEARGDEVTELTQRTRSSVVVISFTGREGQRQGIGTGFIISREGLIATNMHVLGEARPLQVQLADGSQHEVESVHASDRHLDLAIVKIKPPADKPLEPLPLGDSSQVPDGTPVIALGNPHGLKHSVVSGVVSGTREVDGRRMIQLAIPIEPGNSGGPVLDLKGNVLGIVTMKSLVTQNLGFAMEVNSLKPLLEKPNPIPLSRWLTIGTLDPQEWTPLFGARWQQRSGRLLVSGTGQGFGGRSLCLSRRPPPALPYEVAVTVKLEEEAGAAGLAFHADGADRHYGFYPTAGKLRLTRFSGPDVYDWQVLFERPSPHYRPGDWNRLKVRVEEKRIQCFVNDVLLFESTDEALTKGSVGLAKFRDTQAEFKQFEVGAQVTSRRLSAEAAAQARRGIDDLPALARLQPEQLQSTTLGGSATLAQRADELEKRAAELRLMARDLHIASVVEALQAESKKADDEIDLARAALLIARLDDEELDIDAYLRTIERMATEIKASLEAGADEAARLAALKKYLFTENGFHGSRTDYYHRDNSYLSRVMDDREGIPITLCVLYMELGRRLDLVIQGVGLPGHFCVKHVGRDGGEQLLDVYDGATPLTKEQAAKKVLDATDGALRDDHLHPLTKRQILQRMLRNLISLAQSAKDRARMIGYLELLVTLAPDSAEDRGVRAMLKFETGRHEVAIRELDWFFEHKPEGLDLDRIREMQDYFRKTAQQQRGP
ncbi:MAG: tetratricopeptide repeat protein [Planctomycetota bacterium]